MSDQTVHVLLNGCPLCRFSGELPADWPRGHTAVCLNDQAKATCKPCLQRAQGIARSITGLDAALTSVPQHERKQNA